MKSLFYVKNLFFVFLAIFLLEAVNVYAVPSVIDVNPRSGPSVGGQTVTITGINLNNTTDVKFGGISGSNIQNISNTTIKVDTPASVSMVVDIIVTTTSGTSLAVENDRYAFKGDWEVFIPNFNSNTVDTSNVTNLFVNPNSIAVGYLPNDVCVDTNGQTAYAVNSGSNDITPIDVLTSIPLSNISTGAGSSFPILMSLTKAANGDLIGYTANYSSNNISRVNLTTQVATVIPVGANPTGGAVVMDFTTNPPTPIALYVVNSGSSNITRIDLTNFSTSTIPTGPGSSPTFIAITPNQTTAYFTDGNPTLNAVRRIDGVNTVNPTLGVSLTGADINFNTPNLFPEIVVSADGTTGYVTNTGSNTISTINGLQTTTPSIGCTITVQAGPNGMAITPDGKTVYVCNSVNNSISIVSGLPSCSPSILNLVVGNTPTDPSITPDQAPLAYFVAPSSTYTNQTVTFDASSSASPVGTITNYYWDFGDGAQTQTTTYTTTHTYTTPSPVGSPYIAQLRVVNSAGTSTYPSSVYNGKNLLRNGGPTALYTFPITVTNTPNTPTTTTLTTSPNASNLGQLVTFTATVKNQNTLAPITSGLVQFTVDGVNYGTPVAVNNSGIATIQDSTLRGGNHAIRANYLGTSTINPSSGVATQTVNPDPTTTTITSNPNPSMYGESIVFNIHVAANNPILSGTPQGVVQLSYIDPITGPTVFSTPTLDFMGNASYTYPNNTSLDVGSHPITATYVPMNDSNHAGSSGSVIQVVNPVSTTVTLTSNNNPSTYGQNVTFTAIVMSNSSVLPTGSVQFYDGLTLLGTYTLNGSNVATLMTTILSVGSHTITAQYIPDVTEFSPSTSPILVQNVQEATNTVVVANPPSPSSFGQSVTFTATIAPNVPSSTPLTGTVQFVIDGQNRGNPVPINPNRTASLPVANLSIGTHTVQAIYSGGGGYLPSQSLPINYTIVSLPENVVVTSSLNPAIVGQTVVFTGTVKQTGNNPVPTGSVVFTVDGIPTALIALVNGTATFSSATLTVGNHIIIAFYSGDNFYSPSMSNSLVEVIIGVAPPTDIHVHQIKNRFASQTDRINVIKWKKPKYGYSPIVYKIYRDSTLTDFVGSVHVKEKDFSSFSSLSSSCFTKTTFEFRDHNRRKRHKYSYYIVSVDALGNVSAPAAVEFFR